MQFQLKTGTTLFVPQTTREHLLAHPEVTEEVLVAGIAQLAPPDTQKPSYIDLYDTFGNWGASGLVKVEKATFFAFRKGRIAPSSVIDSPGVPASVLALVTKPIEGGFELITAFCTDGIPAQPEPITPMVDPRTEKGLELRKEFLGFWKYHALALPCTPIEGEPFESSWDEIIEKYGNVYHQ
jgi:hypothetical protein